MAARRRSSPRSRSRSTQSNPVPMILGVGVVIVVILVAYATMSGDQNTPEKQPEKKAAASSQEPDLGGGSNLSEGSTGKQLKDPDTPPPNIPSGVLEEGRAMYAKAKRQHVEALRAQKSGESAKFNTLINDSWDTLMKLDTYLEEYADWLEEADMEDWRVPSSYSGVKRLIEQYYQFKGRVKRIKPNRR